MSRLNIKTLVKLKKILGFTVIIGMIAQPINAGVGEATAIFLLISPGARAGGMGEAFVAMANDATATWWNPAGLSWQARREL
ncbi:MAG: hypothetical protein ACK4OO_06270, partial [bacterium]